MSYLTSPKTGLHILRAVADSEFFETELAARGFTREPRESVATLTTDSYETCFLVFSALSAFVTAPEPRDSWSSRRFQTLRNRYSEAEPMASTSQGPPTNPPYDRLFTLNAVSQRAEGTCPHCGKDIFYGSLVEHIKRCAARA
ncbi:MAG: hypothetical protein ACLPY5_04005 [Candidatus Bathyarchaeia archaeon]